MPSQKGLFNKVLNVFRRVARTRRIKKERGIDISYSFGSSANYVNVLSRAGEKVLTGLRCQTDMENRRQVRLFCRGSDLVLSCSKEIVRQLERDFNYNRSTFIYNPLDVEDVANKGSQTPEDFPFAGDNILTISCMARNDYIKGIWHLLKAFAVVATKFPDARLIVLGAGDWSKYTRLAAELGVKDKVAFPGVRKNPFPYVAASDIYVCSSNHEGFPNAVLEAMALKKPLISADCKTGPREILLSEQEYKELTDKYPDGSSVREVVRGEFGILIPDMGEDENYDPKVFTKEERMLATEIENLIEDEQLRKRYSEKAYERALFYTPDRYRDSIHEILER